MEHYVVDKTTGRTKSAYDRAIQAIKKYLQDLIGFPQCPKEFQNVVDILIYPKHQDTPATGQTGGNALSPNFNLNQARSTKLQPSMYASVQSIQSGSVQQARPQPAPVAISREDTEMIATSDQQAPLISRQRLPEDAELTDNELQRLGLTDVSSGIAALIPFDHRIQFTRRLFRR